MTTLIIDLCLISVSLVLVASQKYCITSTSSQQYNEQTELCCPFGIIRRYTVKGQEQECCVNQTFLLDTQLCCGGSVLNNVADDGDETSCCGGIEYKLKHKLCCDDKLLDVNKGGAVIPRNSDIKCCGPLTYNSNKDVCCNYEANFKVIDKLQSHHDKCCSLENSSSAQSFSSSTHFCSMGMIISNEKKMCEARYPMNEDKDLCCQGKFYQDVKKIGKKCCGVKAKKRCINKRRTGGHYGICRKCKKSPKYFIKSMRSKEVNICGHQDSCCGTIPYNRRLQTCCDGKVHTKNPNEKCCGTEIFNKKSKWCKKKKHILKLFMDICYEEHYNIKTHICCYDVKKVVLKTNNTQDQCCESVPYNSEMFICSNDANLISKKDDHLRHCGAKVLKNGEDCCNGATPFDSLNNHCCGDTVIHKSKECCDQKPMPNNGRYTCCKSETRQKQVLQSAPYHDSCCFLNDGSTQTYDSIDNTCSLWQVIPKGIRCWTNDYNIERDICCNGVFVRNGKVNNMSCCGIYSYHVSYQTCKSGKIENMASENKGVSSSLGEPCGRQPYDKTRDICCSGVLVKNGKTLKKQCCGVKSYFIQNQTCCSDTSVKSTERFRGNPCNCPPYCQKSWIGNFQSRDPALLKNKKEICKYKMFLLSKITNKSWRVKSKSRWGEIVQFQKNCECTFGQTTRLILLAKRISKKGIVERRFYLLPNERKNRKEIKRRKCKAYRKRRNIKRRKLRSFNQ